MNRCSLSPAGEVSGSQPCVKLMSAQIKRSSRLSSYVYRAIGWHALVLRLTGWLSRYSAQSEYLSQDPQYLPERLSFQGKESPAIILNLACLLSSFPYNPGSVLSAGAVFVFLPGEDRYSLWGTRLGFMTCQGSPSGKASQESEPRWRN